MQLFAGDANAVLTALGKSQAIIEFKPDGTISFPYASPRIASQNTHGTGCTLSSAMACHLALGASLPDAVAQARAYIVQAIASGQPVQTGQGHGPLNHGFAPRAMVVLDE